MARCAKHGIRVVRVPAYSPRTVAEHAFALAFGLARWVHGPGQRRGWLCGKVLLGGWGAEGRLLQARLLDGRQKKLACAAVSGHHMPAGCLPAWPPLRVQEPAAAGAACQNGQLYPQRWVPPRACAVTTPWRLVWFAAAAARRPWVGQGTLPLSPAVGCWTGWTGATPSTWLPIPTLAACACALLAHPDDANDPRPPRRRAQG